MVLAVVIAALWMATYPDNDDPKNIYYVLWKHGLNRNMNLDNALDAMTHDTWAVKRVAGLSIEQLQMRFGYLQTIEQAPGLGGCSRGKDVVFLRNSHWMVILNNGKAADLVLCKGY